jgi:glucose-6-phosphate 1-dehydrogenase
MDAKKPENTKDKATVFVIFGATGDLARKKLFPSLFELFKNNLLPQKLKIIAASRSPFETNQFLQLFIEGIKSKDADRWQNFAKNIEYVSCDIEKNLNLEAITKKIKEFEDQSNECPQQVLYMAISPFIYEYAFENLGQSKLNLGCTTHKNHAKIVVEKPFGYSLESATILNGKLDNYFDEKHIYRIDHILGKETVQNIFAFRFANEIFEPVWNNKYIDNVQITYSEHIGVDRRGEYYDRAGALRDIIQNHMLQLLTLVTMEEPAKFDQFSIREKKLEILRSIAKMTPEEVVKNTVRAQYEGYLDEEKVASGSQTETYAMTKLFIDSPRWQGVPFYIRTGKKLTGKVTSIIFSLKEKGHRLFKNSKGTRVTNHITIQIQPNEGIGIHLVAKKPGLATELQPVDMEFCYKTSFDRPQPDAYERLLMDIIAGDQTLFLGPISESWKIIDKIREVWDKGEPPLTFYKPGTWGPKEADRLIEKDGRVWLAPLLTICKI